jgi:hypothetical protein
MTLDLAAHLIPVLWGVAVAILIAASGLGSAAPSQHGH